MDRLGIPENETYFASAKKSEPAEIESTYHKLKGEPLLQMFQEAMPDLAMIINSNRQLVYANSNLIKFLDIEDFNLPLGSRLGNLLNCIHSNEQPHGCGTTNACRFCGVVNTILDSISSGKPVVREARITAMSDREVISYDLKIKASPLFYQGMDLTIVCINDISDKKLRKIETSYISDIYKTAEHLSDAVTSMHKENLDEENLKILEDAVKVNSDLLTNLFFQQMLPAAEEGTLTLNVEKVTSMKVLRDLEEYFKAHEISKHKQLFIDPLSHNVTFKTDADVLMKVLIMLTNNALEASTPKMVVRVSVKLKDRVLEFSIYSVPRLSDEVKHQIFQRSFSTKSDKRGLGTYTARLLTTKYLKGKITFTSDESGTFFIVDVPLSI